MQRAIFKDLFDEFQEKSKAQPSWLSALRVQAMDRFMETGFIIHDREAWKYTKLHKFPFDSYAFEAQEPVVPTKATLREDGLLRPEAINIVTVNGHYTPSLSDTDSVVGLSISSLVEESERLRVSLLKREETQDSWMDLNAAFLNDGLVLTLQENVHLTKPVHILHLATEQSGASMIHMHNVIELKQAASMELIETFSGKQDQAHYFRTVITDVIACRESKLSHTILQTESESAYHLLATRLHLEASATYRHFILNQGARLSRITCHAALEAPNAHVSFDGIYLAKRDQHMDFYLPIEHKTTNTTSQQHYQGVLDDQATGIFYGKTCVAKEADHTKASQLHRSLLLSDKAYAISRPELRILNENVVCSHGSTTSDLDEASLFYLRSRGLDAVQAKHMLVEGFVFEMLEKVDSVLAKTLLRERLNMWFEQGGIVYANI